jgi:predicted CoA-binding protein
MDKPTVVIGASPDPSRYGYKAVRALQDHRHTVYGVSIKEGEVNGLVIEKKKNHYQNIHTVTLYVAPRNQEYWIDYVLSLKPKRIIFNPGTENPDFIKKAEEQGIECVIGCTLVMLAIGNY